MTTNGTPMTVPPPIPYQRMLRIRRLDRMAFRTAALSCERAWRISLVARACDEGMRRMATEVGVTKERRRCGRPGGVTAR